MTSPRLKVERVPIDKLSQDPSNVRRHPEKNMEAIRASLARFGQQKPVVVGADGVVIAGNGTLAAARDLGWTHLSVARSKLSGAEAVAYAIADNRTAELAEWDRPGLASLLQSMGADAYLDVGWTQEDAESLFSLLRDVEPDEWAGAFVRASKGEPEFSERSFILHRSQATEVDRAIRRMKQKGAQSDLNENSNGNALFGIIQEWLGGSGG